MSNFKFIRNSTYESAAAFLPHVRLVFSHYPTEMRHGFKHRISAVSNLIHTLGLMHWACVNLIPPKEKKTLGYSRSKVTWTNLSLNFFNIVKNYLLMEREGWQFSSMCCNMSRFHLDENDQVSSFSLAGPNLRMLNALTVVTFVMRYGFAGFPVNINPRWLSLCSNFIT